MTPQKRPCPRVPNGRKEKVLKLLYHPPILSGLIMFVGLVPLITLEQLLGRSHSGSLEMLYVLVVLHVVLFVIRPARKNKLLETKE